MFAVAFALVACEGEDLSKVNKPNGGGNTPTGENRNANDARTQREYGRLEFPRLKSGAVTCNNQWRFELRHRMERHKKGAKVVVLPAL